MSDESAKRQISHAAAEDSCLINAGATVGWQQIVSLAAHASSFLHAAMPVLLFASRVPCSVRQIVVLQEAEKSF